MEVHGESFVSYTSRVLNYHAQLYSLQLFVLIYSPLILSLLPMRPTYGLFANLLLLGFLRSFWREVKISSKVRSYLAALLEAAWLPHQSPQTLDLHHFNLRLVYESLSATLSSQRHLLLLHHRPGPCLSFTSIVLSPDQLHDHHGRIQKRSHRQRRSMYTWWSLRTLRISRQITLTIQRSS